MKTLNTIITIIWFPFLMALLYFVPFDHLPNTCAFVKVTGYPCCTCGMTRAMMAIVRGDWYKANAMNQMVFPFTALLAGIWIYMLIDVFRGESSRRNWLYRHLTVIILYTFAAFIIFGAARILILWKYY